MKKKRIIPIVLFQNGQVIQSKEFSDYRSLGNPFDSLRRLSEWNADEVHFIDIGDAPNVNLRTDLKKQLSEDYLKVLSEISRISLMPLAAGGRICSMADISARLAAGADKVIINTAIFSDPSFIQEAVRYFGSQCITASLDVKEKNHIYKVFTNGGKTEINMPFEDAVKYVENLGVGEILVNSINRDGTKLGFDLPLASQAALAVDVPVVIAGGAGKWEDFGDVLSNTEVDGVAAANLFQHVDQSVYLCHKYLKNSGFNVRPPKLIVSPKEN